MWYCMPKTRSDKVSNETTSRISLKLFISRRNYVLVSVTFIRNLAA